MTESIVTSERALDWDDAEVRCRLGKAYALILNYRPKDKETVTADGGEFGDQTRTPEEATAPDEAVPS